MSSYNSYIVHRGVPFHIHPHCKYQFYRSLKETEVFFKPTDLLMWKKINRERREATSHGLKIQPSFQVGDLVKAASMSAGIL